MSNNENLMNKNINNIKYNNNIPAINSSKNRPYNNVFNEMNGGNENTFKMNFNFKDSNINGLNQMNYANRSTIITGNKDFNSLKNNPFQYQKMNNNTVFNFQRNSSSSNIFSDSKRKYNIKENSPKVGKRIINYPFKNGDKSKLRQSNSTNDINYNNNKQTRSFFGLNNNINYSISYSNSVNNQNQNYNYSDSVNSHQNNYSNNRSFPFSNTALEKLDENVNINEKIISSPFQAYQSYQKDKKANNLSNRANQSLNTGKRVLFENNKDKDKKNKNINNNYQNNFYNFRGKEARILQNLVNNLQSNIPEYDKQFINEDDVKNMKNKQLGKNNNQK